MDGGRRSGRRGPFPRIASGTPPAGAGRGSGVGPLLGRTPGRPCRPFCRRPPVAPSGRESPAVARCGAVARASGGCSGDSRADARAARGRFGVPVHSGAPLRCRGGRRRRLPARGPFAGAGTSPGMCDPPARRCGLTAAARGRARGGPASGPGPGGTEPGSLQRTATPLGTRARRRRRAGRGSIAAPLLRGTRTGPGARHRIGDRPARSTRSSIRRRCWVKKLVKCIPRPRPRTA